MEANRSPSGGSKTMKIFPKKNSVNNPVHPPSVSFRLICVAELKKKRSNPMNEPDEAEATKTAHPKGCPKVKKPIAYFHRKPTTTKKKNQQQKRKTPRAKSIFFLTKWTHNPQPPVAICLRPSRQSGSSLSRHHQKPIAASRPTTNNK